jgi:hypothetical protein
VSSLENQLLERVMGIFATDCATAAVSEEVYDLFVSLTYEAFRLKSRMALQAILDQICSAGYKEAGPCFYQPDGRLNLRFHSPNVESLLRLLNDDKLTPTENRALAALKRLGGLQTLEAIRADAEDNATTCMEALDGLVQRELALHLSINRVSHWRLVNPEE